MGQGQPLRGNESGGLRHGYVRTIAGRPQGLVPAQGWTGILVSLPPFLILLDQAPVWLDPHQPELATLLPRLVDLPGF